jgi:hypothetical protein
VRRTPTLATLVLLSACAAGAPAPERKDAERPLPDVICQPCGQMQPTAYVCAGPVMVRADVPASRVPELKRYCAERRRR